MQLFKNIRVITLMALVATPAMQANAGKTALAYAVSAAAGFTMGTWIANAHNERLEEQQDSYLSWQDFHKKLRPYRVASYRNAAIFFGLLGVVGLRAYLKK